MRTMEGLHAAGLGSARRDPNTPPGEPLPEGADEMRRRSTKGCIVNGNERGAV